MKISGMVLFVVLAVFLIKCQSNPVESMETNNSVLPLDRAHIEEALLKKLNTKCSQRDVSSCVMLKIVTYMNRMLKKSAIEVNDSLEITKNENSSVIEEIDGEGDELLARAKGSDDAELSILIADKLWTFVQTRSLHWKMFDDTDFVVSNSPQGTLNVGMSIKPSDAVETGRRRRRRRGNLRAIVAAIAMKIGLLGGLALKALALLVGKALLVSKIALLLASIIGLKKLFSQEKHVTYEVVAHPHHTSHSESSSSSHQVQPPQHDTYSSSGWSSRGLSDHLYGIMSSFGQEGGDAQDLAYEGQKPEQ